MDKNILISACLLGRECRYDGKHSKLDLLNNAKLNWIPICPEELGNLGTPRPAAEMQSNGKVITESGEDVSEQFNDGANKSLKIAKENNCKTAILKSKSPSCGKGKIYDGTFSKKLIKGNGVFVQKCNEHGINVISSDEDNILKKLL